MKKLFILACFALPLWGNNPYDVLFADYDRDPYQMRAFLGNTAYNFKSDMLSDYVKRGKDINLLSASDFQKVYHSEKTSVLDDFKQLNHEIRAHTRSSLLKGSLSAIGAALFLKAGHILLSNSYFKSGFFCGSLGLLGCGLIYIQANNHEKFYKDKDQKKKACRKKYKKLNNNAPQLKDKLIQKLNVYCKTTEPLQVLTLINCPDLQLYDDITKQFNTAQQNLVEMEKLQLE